jgi:hypothetical protein
LATWTFDFAFDKVLIFIRPINEEQSEIVEVRRRL